MDHKSIFVTQPSLPPLDEFHNILKEIWDSRCLTNNGKFHQQFERELAEYLGVEYLSLFTNGTLALITALQLLKITGEVITTPYSFVATTHALWWNNIKPVFVDIEPDYCNLDPEKIESAIGPKTNAILPVHIYGNPCNVNRIQEIADIYGLKVIYDAAHAFGVKKDGVSILEFGDVSILSFHATKIFNTFEGGAIVCHDKSMKNRIDHLKNFGFTGEIKVVAPGINAKMSEFQAGLGILQLNYFHSYVQKRKEITERYRGGLKDIKGIRFLEDIKGVKHNYSYFPIFINGKDYGLTRDELYEILQKYNIYGRRYFYPLISQFSPYRKLDSASPANLPVAEDINTKVICLPIYTDLEDRTIDKIISIIMEK